MVYHRHRLRRGSQSSILLLASAAMLFATTYFSNLALASTNVSIDQKYVWHLGDREIGGWPTLYGSKISWTFSLPYVHDSVQFHIDVFDTTSRHNEVRLNGKWLGHLSQNPSESAYKTTTINIPISMLNVGNNTLVIEAGRLEDNEQGLDDFLINNIFVHLK